VNLNERELEQLLKYMDVDGDGEVSQDDFVTFLRYSGDQLADKSSLQSTTIVDITVSRNHKEEAALHSMGFQMCEGDLNGECFGTSRVYLWYRRMAQMPSGCPTAPLVNLYLHNSKVGGRIE